MRYTSGKQKPKQKYNNIKKTYDGIRFDSIAELERYKVLKYRQSKGMISDLKCHVPFTLIPTIRIPGEETRKAIKYIADFTYKEDGEFVVEDVKSKATITDVYILKERLMLWKYGIIIRRIMT